MAWKKIHIPKSLYLPTGSHDGPFKDSGTRVNPSDKVEIDTGSHQVRINGTPHHLLIPVDNLPLDETGTLQLDKAAPAVATHSGGQGHAYVGGKDQATAAAKGDGYWTSWAANPEEVEKASFYIPPPPLGTIQELPPQEIARTAAYVPPVGFVQAPLSSGISSGSQDLDALLQRTLGASGFAKGVVTYVSGNAALPENVGATMTVDNLDAVFAKIHLDRSERPIIVAHFPQGMTPSDELRLSVGESLFGLIEAVKGQGRCAVLILSPDWGQGTPPLLRQMIQNQVSLNVSLEDGRFITATVQGHTMTFPKPQL